MARSNRRAFLKTAPAAAGVVETTVPTVVDPVVSVVQTTVPTVVEPVVQVVETTVPAVVAPVVHIQRERKRPRAIPGAVLRVEWWC